MSPELILQRFHSKHGNRYTYPSNLSDYNKNTDKIPIFCPVKEHGLFYQSIENHMRGQGCPKCYRQSLYLKNIISRTRWIERFEKVHGKGKYNYSKLPENQKADVIFPITCFEHNVTFYQTPKTHYELKRGCQKCGEKQQWEKRKNKIIIRSEFIEKAQQKNGLGYEYINLLKEFGLNNTIGIFCSAHNKLFFCTGQEHLDGKGCPECESGK